MRPVAFQTALMYGYAPARRAVFLGFYFNLVGKRSVDNPRPLVGDGLSIRSAQGRVWSTQEPAKPAVHTGVCLDVPKSLAVLLFIFYPAPRRGRRRPPGWGHVLMVQPSSPLLPVKASRSDHLRPHGGFRSCIGAGISYRIDV